MERCDVAIIGAGPYGLSAAAHLAQVKGLDLRLFGEPMSFWERYMPTAMLLRSPWVASHIADPDGRLTLDAYRSETSNERLAYPVGVRDFIRYGRWFHDQIGVGADTRKITCIDPAPDGFRLDIDDGSSLHARRVVVAGGIQPFAYRPPIFYGLPRQLVSHTSEQRQFEHFNGKKVLIVGAGQSAIEAAAFSREAGADVEVIIRRDTLRWLGHRQWMHGKAVGWMFYGRGDVGPAGLSVLVQHPNLFRRLPRSLQQRWGARAVRAAVSHRLMPRTTGIPMHMTRSIAGVREGGGRLHVRFEDGGERVVDHVVLGTGYRIDVAKYPFFGSALLERLDLIDGYPRLRAGFETSLPGLHIVGAPSMWSYGPLMRFVAGTEFTGRTLAKRIAHAWRSDPVPWCLSSVATAGGRVDA